MTRSTTRATTRTLARRAAGGLMAAGMAAAVAASGAGMAQAAPQDDLPRVIADANIRTAPGTSAGISKIYPAGTDVDIACVSPGSPVGPDQDRDWYALSDGKGWISATLVRHAGEVEPCHTGLGNARGRTTGDLNVSNGPSVRDTRIGTIPVDTAVELVCSVDRGGDVDGSRDWYLLSGGNWVSAQYVRADRDKVPACDS